MYVGESAFAVTKGRPNQPTLEASLRASLFWELETHFSGMGHRLGEPRPSQEALLETRKGVAMLPQVQSG